MSASRQSPFNLVPEVALLQPLPEHWQKRFADALTLMHQDWQQPRSWQEIANASAISPSHFHRQFTELFHETPGQYLARLRLQHAVNLLMSQEQHSVTDVAHACGFSSSQALAKALKESSASAPKPSAKWQSTPLRMRQQSSSPNSPTLARNIPSKQSWYKRCQPNWSGILRAG